MATTLQVTDLHERQNQVIAKGGSLRNCSVYNASVGQGAELEMGKLDFYFNGKCW